MNKSEVESKLQNVKQSADASATARCPSHDDQRNSLKITEKDDKVLLYCHAECPIEKICEDLNSVHLLIFIWRRFLK